MSCTLKSPAHHRFTLCKATRCAIPVASLVLAALFVSLSTTAVSAQQLIQTYNDPTTTTFDLFGFGVDISGSRVLVGAFGDDSIGNDVGQAHLFDLTSGTLLYTFDDPTPSAGGFDGFGNSVSIDGNFALIGAWNDNTAGFSIGQAHLFNAATGSFLRTFDDPTITTSDSFGSSVALSGSQVLIGASFDDTAGTNVGQAHLFNASTGSLLHTFTDPTVTTQDRFGSSAAMSGNLAVIGAPGDDTGGTGVGQALLYDTLTGNLLHTFDDPNVFGNDAFGSAVALDGNNVLVGAPQGDGGTFTLPGEAYLFDAVTGDLLRTFTDPTTTIGDRFGTSVAISGSLALIGSDWDEDDTGYNGQAYLFDITSGALLATLDDPTPTFRDQFGSALAFDGNTIVIGAPFDGTFGGGVGQAHSFAIPEPGTIVVLALLAAVLLVRTRVYRTRANVARYSGPYLSRDCVRR